MVVVVVVTVMLVTQGSLGSSCGGGSGVCGDGALMGVVVVMVVVRGGLRWRSIRPAVFAGAAILARFERASSSARRPGFVALLPRCSECGSFGLRDHYAFWKKKGQTSDGGKVFMFDLSRGAAPPSLRPRGAGQLRRGDGLGLSGVGSGRDWRRRVGAGVRGSAGVCGSVELGRRAEQGRRRSGCSERVSAPVSVGRRVLGSPGGGGGVLARRWDGDIGRRRRSVARRSGASPPRCCWRQRGSPVRSPG